ncbi:MAG: glycosyltransferase [Magnetococcales bacterium]|nr:glycosyltransferase [Magnetococcales bacterium]
MKPDAPMLAIGLPVYNGAAFISQTIQSILAQTFKDFSLIISDNASTDATQEICESFARQDSRIVYFRQKSNQGINKNASQVLVLSKKAKYFALIGHDDIWEPTFSEKIIAEMEKNSEISVGFSLYDFIDEKGSKREMDEYVQSIDHVLAMKKMSRRERISFQSSSNFIHGVIRRAVLFDDLFLFRRGIYEDVYCLRYLAGLGPFFVVPESLFKKRIHKQNYSSSAQHKQEHQSTNCAEATRELTKLLKLSLWERLSLYYSLFSYFHLYRPLLGQIKRVIRLMSSSIRS